MQRTVIAFDLGGTNLRMAAVHENGEVLLRRCAATPRSGSAEEIIATIVDLAEDIQSNINGQTQIVSMAAALPATIDEAAGILTKVPNLPVLDGVAIGRILSDALGLNVILRNDATSAAAGEHWLGASADAANSICVTLGTGIGGGLILDGRLHRGPDGTAGEIGHICIERDGRECGCGSRGCLEQYASASAVARMAKEAELGQITAKELYELAEAGDDDARTVLSNMGAALGVGLSGLINLLNPEVIVICGGLSAAWDQFIEPLEAEIKWRAYKQPSMRAKIVKGMLGDDAGILGIARLAFESLEVN